MVHLHVKKGFKKHNTKVCLQYKNVAVPSEHEGSLISLFKEVHIKTHMVIRRVREIFIQFVVVDLTRDWNRWNYTQRLVDIPYWPFFPRETRFKQKNMEVNTRKNRQPRHYWILTLIKERKKIIRHGRGSHTMFTIHRSDLHNRNIEW